MATNEEDLNVYTLKSFRENLSDIVGKVKYAKSRVRITNRGKTAGYFIPEEDMRLIERAIEHLEDEEDRQAVEAWQNDPVKKTIPFEQVVEDIGA